MDCCSSKTGVLFKLSVTGTFLALFFALIGMVYPFNRIHVMFPLAWLVAILFLIPSTTLYFDVRDKFWAEVMEKKKEG